MPATSPGSMPERTHKLFRWVLIGAVALGGLVLFITLAADRAKKQQAGATGATDTTASGLPSGLTINEAPISVYSGASGTASTGNVTSNQYPAPAATAAPRPAPTATPAGVAKPPTPAPKPKPAQAGPAAVTSAWASTVARYWPRPTPAAPAAPAAQARPTTPTPGVLNYERIHSWMVASR